MGCIRAENKNCCEMDAFWDNTTGTQWGKEREEREHIALPSPSICNQAICQNTPAFSEIKLWICLFAGSPPHCWITLQWGEEDTICGPNPWYLLIYGCWAAVWQRSSIWDISCSPIDSVRPHTCGIWATKPLKITRDGNFTATFDV